MHHSEPYLRNIHIID